MRFAGDALQVLNHDNYGQHTVDGQQRLVEPAKPNSYPQVIGTPAHLVGQAGFDDPFPAKTQGRYSYPKGMEGVVDPTYPVNSPLYGQPIDSPIHPGRPMEMNAAEYEGLQNVYRGKDRPYIPGSGVR